MSHFDHFPRPGEIDPYRPCRLNWCPVGWWLWRAGCISQDTYLLYLLDEDRVSKFTQFIGAFQAAKGVLTAGPRKAVKYAGAKLKKMFKSQMKK